MKNVKTKILWVGLVVAASVYGFSVQHQEGETNSLLRENVEALATGESGDGYCHTNEDYTAICNYYDNGAICPCGF